jgi:hypothetical protein
MIFVCYIKLKTLHIWVLVDHFQVHTSKITNHFEPYRQTDIMIEVNMPQTYSERLQLFLSSHLLNNAYVYIVSYKGQGIMFPPLLNIVHLTILSVAQSIQHHMDWMISE